MNENSLTLISTTKKKEKKKKTIIKFKVVVDLIVVFLNVVETLKLRFFFFLSGLFFTFSLWADRKGEREKRICLAYLEGGRERVRIKVWDSGAFPTLPPPPLFLLLFILLSFFLGIR